MMRSSAATSSPSSPNMKEVTCRIIVVGNHKNRVTRVFEMLNDEFELKVSTNTNHRVRIQFIPCVARFGAFKNDKGEVVRYLERLDCWVDLIDEKLRLSEKPTSLQPFFDHDGEGDQVSSNEVSFPGISGAVIGGGIEAACDTSSIRALFQSLSPERKITTITIGPNPEYGSMKEELMVFKQLNPIEKEIATRSRTMGPGKMAKTAHDFALQIVANAVSVIMEKIPEPGNETQPTQPTKPESDDLVETVETVSEYIPDFDNVHYSCRTCRSVLFGERDLQDPPHIPSRHSFSYRKHGIGSSDATHACQSHFLQAGLPWMQDMSDTEGKFHCPKCSAKVGTWNWSGAQCSCGTWVVPAIQVPKSRVDIVQPRTRSLPAGTVLSPTLQYLDQFQQHSIN